MDYVSFDDFKKHLIFPDTNDVCVVASPFVSMMADHLGLGYKTLRTDDSFTTQNKYKNIIIDIYEGIVYPKTKISHEHRWLIHVLGLLENGGRIKVRIPSHMIQKLCYTNSGSGFVKRKEITKINVKHIYIYGDYAIVDLLKEDVNGQTTIQYHTGESISVSSDNLVVLKKFVKNHYDYVLNVDYSTSFEFQATNGQRGYKIGQTFKQQFEHFCAKKWNKDHIVVKNNNGPYPKIYRYEDVNDSPTTRDVFYLKNKKNVNIFIEKFKDKNFIDFINNISYNNFGGICSSYKRLIFNQKILNYNFHNE